jgi:DNA-binding MarR family transcriptional regulator
LSNAAKLATEVRRIVRRLRLRLLSESPPDQITPSQLSVLTALVEKTSWTQSELAARDRVRPQTMGTIVTSLEDLRLVSRSACQRDGRRIWIKITTVGRKVLRQGRVQRNSWLARVLSSELTVEQRQQLAAALPLLAKLADAD